MPNFFNLCWKIILMVSGFLHFSVSVLMLPLFFSLSISEISFAEEIESPKKQLQNGTPLTEIMCKPGYALAILQSDKPACLTPTTLLKLEERNYVKTVVKEFQLNSVNIEDASSTLNDNTEQITSQNTGSTISGNTGDTQITNVPASGSSIVNFYIIDDDLNTNRGGIDIIETQGLLEFLINDVLIEGPETMVETSPDSGKFFVRLQLPNSINGEPLTQDDVVEVRYTDISDSTGNQRISVKSIPLSQTFAQVQTSGGGATRIGHEFTVRIYEPDANLDSKESDRIPLSKIEYRGEGGIRTTLANPVFDANGSSLRETGDSTGVFEAIIKIPRTIDGQAVHVGDWYELRYVDNSNPSNSSEEIKLRGKIG